MVLVPQGQWRVPPQQRILRRGETEFDLDRVATELTVIISTSVSLFTPLTDTPVAALESLQSNVALRWCRKLLVFDKVPSKQEIEEMRQDTNVWMKIAKGDKWVRTWNAKRGDYDEYCATLRAMKETNHPALFNVELIFLPRFGHLFGTVKEAFDHIRTPYVFITQHDLRLSGKFVAADVQNILEVLHNGAVKYVNLNRDVNSSERSRAYFQLLPSRSLVDDTRQPSGLRLTAMAGYSDQAHFAEVDWYRREVISAIPPDQQRTAMEHVLNERWQESPEWRGTFLYGGHDEGPFVLDLIYGLQVYDQEGKLRKLPPPPNRPAE